MFDSSVRVRSREDCEVPMYLPPLGAMGDIIALAFPQPYALTPNTPATGSHGSFALL